MAEFSKLAKDLILLDGKVDADEVKLLKKHLYADGKIDQSEVDFVIELVAAVKKKGALSEDFQKFFLKVLTDRFLADGKLDAAETATIKKKVVGTVSDELVKKFLVDLKKKVTSPSADFEKLYSAHIPAATK
jgi:uncharacterized membrane protein YebE (DUF533 family)